MDNIRSNPPASRENPREIVDALDEMIAIRMGRLNGPVTPEAIRSDNEKVELLKRRITDYLLSIDKRPGVYFQDKNNGGSIPRGR